MRIYLQLAVLLSWSLTLSSVVQAQRTYTTKHVDDIIHMDGRMDESAWSDVEAAEDFTVQSPVYGNKSIFKSRFKVLYNEHAIYVAGELYDPNPDSVNFALSTRDDTGNADWIGVSIDTYGNNVNAFGFIVTAAGVEADLMRGTDDDDFSWNAVWKSVAIQRDFGWSFEMKIPYSAIRFPNRDIQNWKINFHRVVRRTREASSWNPIDPQLFGEITQSGNLKGIQGIKSPVRLSFTPYATGYLENSYDAVLERQTWKRRLTGGMDLKFGLNDAFTLDMSLIPDFGQTTSDRQVLNLGPFEVQFNENRPFFIEGTDLFRIGDVFYSRRIASTPYNYTNAYNDLDDSKGEEVVLNPSLAPMLNGTKVSGRTKKGLGIGVFNALEGTTHAIIADSMGIERKVETNPLTNYNSFVLSQNLKNNSVVSFVNTNVMREGGSRDANVTVATASVYSKNGMYRISPTVKISSIFEGDVPVFGHTVGTGLAKVAGKWQYNFSYNEQSDTYDPNDLGFLYINNTRSYSSGISWNDYTQSKRFFRRNAGISVWYQELYKPQLFSNLTLDWFVGGLHKKQVYTRLSGGINPFGSVNHFESRSFGKEVIFKPNANLRWFFTTDYSKRFALDGSYNHTQFFGIDQHSDNIYLSPRIRFSNRWMFILEMSADFLTNDYGYVNHQKEGFEDAIMLGVRDRVIVENTIRSEFIFTKRMGIDLRLRHYWQQVSYDYFNELLNDGVVERSPYNPLDENGKSIHNTSYNAFTVDVNYRWVFMPGSEIRIVYKNNIFQSKTELDPSYFRTFDELFSAPQINSISVKFLFFIDVLYFSKKHKDKK